MIAKPRIFDCANRHTFLLFLSDEQYQATIRKAAKLQIQCPHCKVGGVKFTAREGNLASGKLFACKHGHCTTVYPFKNGIVGIDWGDDHINIEASISEALSYMKTAKCQFWTLVGTPDAILCNESVLPIDDSPLELPGVPNLNTHTFVGDIWDKNKCPPPREVAYDTDGAPVQTEFNKRHKEYVKGLRKKTGERLSKLKGIPLDKPTENHYRDGARKDE